MNKNQQKKMTYRKNYVLSKSNTQIFLEEKIKHLNDFLVRIVNTVRDQYGETQSQYKSKNRNLVSRFDAASGLEKIDKHFLVHHSISDNEQNNNSSIRQLKNNVSWSSGDDVFQKIDPNKRRQANNMDKKNNS